MKAFAFGVALAALTAAAAGAAEIRHYTMQASEDDHPGREYTVHGVRVVEGQPRWAIQRRSVMDDILAQPNDNSVTTIIGPRFLPRWRD